MGEATRVTNVRVAVVVVIAVVAVGFIVFRMKTGSDPVAAGATSGTTQGPSTPSATGVPGPGSTVPSAQLQQQLQLLACLRGNESEGEYTAVSPSGEFFGAYQFDQQTWNNTATHVGATNLVGVQPNQATPADQDAMALALLQWQGTSPWNGDPCVG